VGRAYDQVHSAQTRKRHFCVWDNLTDKPAEEAAGKRRYTDLQLDKAFDYARFLNRDKAKN
jgi:hypothetical protein